MRGQRAAGIALGAVAAGGAVLSTASVFIGGDLAWRTGLVLLLLGLAGLGLHRSHCNTIRLIAHQRQLAVQTVQEHQQWAEYGMRAGEIETLARLGTPVHDAPVVPLPLHRRQQQHRSGA